ncbi:MAG TPA: ATP-binding protein [Gemmatimonadales bacterium]|nr:ATP-binding protein [Gemmatimonadales bacterium]
MPRRPPPAQPPNPFRISGVVAGEHFTDRADELRRIEQALLEPGDKLLVFGRRRMGKSSTLDRAIEHVTERDAVAFRADLAGATTVTDVANRILQGTSRALGRRWQDLLAGFVKALTLRVTLSADPVTGIVLPTLTVEGRLDSLDHQRASLERVLDTVEQTAEQRGIRIGVVLDEFQAIHRFGGESAEWHLRSVIERHKHVSYVAAGSELSLIEAMQGEGRAFYKLFRLLHHGPIEPEHFARWIDERLAGAGLEPAGIGARIVATAGPRTRDVVELARTVYDVASPRGAIAESTLGDALREMLVTNGEPFRRLWEELPPSQQNVLRAIAAGEPRLYARDSRERFGFKSTAEVAQAVEWLAKREVLTVEAKKAEFDNPFFKAWVIERALPDVGILESTADIVRSLQASPAASSAAAPAPAPRDASRRPRGKKPG